MRQLKGVVQDTADRINDSIISDNISAIKAMVVIDKNVQEAIQTHLQKKQKDMASQTNENIIVTGDEIRSEMNREMGE